VETGLIDWIRDQSGGGTSTITGIGASLIKYGLGDRADVELGVVPYERARFGSDRASGFGDLQLRSKVRLTGPHAAVQVALDPFVKLPTAKRTLGNRKVEAGVTVPVGVAIGGPFSVAFAPELDWRADGDGHGYHAAMVQLASVGIAASERLSFTAELWRQWDWDPAAPTRQASADAAAAMLIGTDVQVDAGANFGLVSRTPGIELYAGVSKRF
jgi:hypothetical protein